MLAYRQRHALSFAIIPEETKYRKLTEASAIPFGDGIAKGLKG